MYLSYVRVMPVGGIRERQRPAAAAALGMRRLGWVTIHIDGDDIDCRAHGVGNRHPVSTPVSLSTALDLKSQGVPTLIHRYDELDEPDVITA